MMDFIHDRSSNIPFSLHDSKIKKIIFNDDILTLKIDKLFQYTENGEKNIPEMSYFTAAT